MISITHYRHATSIIVLDGKKLLVDPLFADKGSYPPIVNTKNPRRNPLVNLPVPYGDLLDVDGVIITHNHNDHFDRLAKAEIPGDIPLLCQKEDFEAFSESGFTRITALDNVAGWLDFDCKRIKGYHGGHVFRKKLGKSSAFHIKGRESDVYITGDTLLTPAVRRSLKKNSPHNIIAYGGGARIKILGKITMNHRDIKNIAVLCPRANLIVVHLDSLNHCFETREVLRTKISGNRGNIFIPDDGERIEL